MDYKEGVCTGKGRVHWVKGNYGLGKVNSKISGGHAYCLVYVEPNKLGSAETPNGLFSKVAYVTYRALIT